MDRGGGGGWTKGGRGVGKYGEIWVLWGLMGNYGKLWGNMGKHMEIWGFMVHVLHCVQAVPVAVQCSCVGHLWSTTTAPALARPISAMPNRLTFYFFMPVVK